MVFRRKNPREAVSRNAPAMRSRDPGQPGPGKDIHRGDNPLARRFVNDDEPDTMDLEQPARFDDAEDDKPETTTRLLGEDAARDHSDAEALEDPVTGFLVIVSGPGRGHVSTLGYGMNSIGRDRSQRVSLDHGDSHISRNNHCFVTFDSRAGAFYIQPGEGRNLVYLDDEPVLVPTPLFSSQNIRLGDTVLRFVALCGEDFSWE